MNTKKTGNESKETYSYQEETQQEETQQNEAKQNELSEVIKYIRRAVLLRGDITIDDVIVGGYQLSYFLFTIGAKEGATYVMDMILDIACDASKKGLIDIKNNGKLSKSERSEESETDSKAN